MTRFETNLSEFERKLALTLGIAAMTAAAGRSSGRLKYALIAAGRMRPSGLAEVEAAKADGRWDAAYESQRAATVPPDLAAALAANPEAGKAFESLSKTDQYAVILDIVTARSIQTRSAHILRAVAALDVRGGSPAGVTNGRRDNGAPGMRSGR